MSVLHLILVVGSLVCVQGTVPPGCQGDLDITFIMDQSESILENDPIDAPEQNWKLLKEFVKGLIHQLPIGTGTRVAMMKYSTSAEVQWYLDQYSHSLDVEREVDMLKCAGGNTNTAEALQMAREQIFRSERGDRLDSKDLVILMTDGLSTIRGGDDLYGQADFLHNTGIEIYVVAIGKYVDDEELRHIVKDFSKNIIQVQDFRDLAEVQRLLAYRICGLPDPPPITRKPEECKNIVDLTFLVDNSGSITDKNRAGEPDNYLLLKNFLRDLVDQIDVGVSRTRVAVIRFSDIVHVVFRLGEYRDTNDVKEKILTMPFRGLDTNTSGAIRTALSMVYSGSPGDRPDIPDVIVLVTDGESTIEQNKTVHEAMRAKKMGIKMYVVGVTEEINVDELKEMASDPVDEHFFDLTAVKYLSSITYRLINNLCRKP